MSALAQPVRNGSLERPLVRGAVVGEHAAHTDALGVEQRQRALEEADGVDASRGRQQLRLHEAAREVDGHALWRLDLSC